MAVETSLSLEEIAVSSPFDPQFCECDCDPCDPPAMVCTDIPDIGYHHCT
jgi:hypothetical protein